MNRDEIIAAIRDDVTSSIRDDMIDAIRQLADEAFSASNIADERACRSVTPVDREYYRREEDLHAKHAIFLETLASRLQGIPQ